jgi:hypothetical protein
MHIRGASTRQIGDKIGVSHTAIENWIREMEAENHRLFLSGIGYEGHISTLRNQAREFEREAERESNDPSVRVMARRCMLTALDALAKCRGYYAAVKVRIERGPLEEKSIEELKAIIREAEAKPIDVVARVIPESPKAGTNGEGSGTNGTNGAAH